MPTPAAAPSGYTYLGCYVDYQIRLLDGAIYTDESSMTVPACESYCKTINIGRFYPFFGVEAGNQCFCGSNFTRTPDPNEGVCSEPCSGNQTQLWEEPG